MRVANLIYIFIIGYITRIYKMQKTRKDKFPLCLKNVHGIKRILRFSNTGVFEI